MSFETDSQTDEWLEKGIIHADLRAPSAAL